MYTCYRYVLLGVYVFIFSLFPNSVDSVTISWIGGSGGDWNNSPSWSPNTVPGPNDIVVINTTATITASNAVNVSSLVINADNATVIFDAFVTIATGIKCRDITKPF